MTDDQNELELLKNGLIISHGLPASGKSEWAQDMAVRYPDRVVHINHNIIRLRRFGTDYKETGFFKKHELEINQIKDTLMENAWKEGKTVIVSDSNLKETELPALANKARERGLSFGQKYFELPLEESLNRNHLRLSRGGFHLSERNIINMARDAVGKDGRLKEFRIGPKMAFAYDRAGNDDERFVTEWNAKQQEKYPIRSKLLANFDMDGTLADTRIISNLHLSQDLRNFDAFHKASEFVPPNEAVLRDMFRAYEAGLTISVTTARLEAYSGETTRWLENNNAPVSILKHRHEGDKRPDHDAKVDMIAEFRRDGFEVAHAWDDNPSAIAAFKESNVRLTEVPFHTPVEPSQGLDTYPPITFASPFESGLCLRCGQPFKGSGPLGPKCRLK